MSIKKIIFEKMMSKKCINLIIIIIVRINKLRNIFNQIDIFVVACDYRNFGFVHISYLLTIYKSCAMVVGRRI